MKNSFRKLFQRNYAWLIKQKIFKGGSYQSYFIFEINVGKSRIRHTTTLKLKNEFKIGSKSIEDDVKSKDSLVFSI